MKNYEEDADYFALAMLMPKDAFLKTALECIGEDGMCNVFAVAEKFHVDYIDVITRSKDLKAWTNIDN